MPEVTRRTNTLRGAALTKVLITINTNKALQSEINPGTFVSTEGEIPLRVQDKLYKLLDELIAESSSLFGNEPYVKRLDFGDEGVEVGGKYHKIHLHVTVDIYHFLERYSVKKLQERITKWIRDQGLDYYVNVKLLTSKGENYANKEKRKESKLDRRLDPEEFDKLSEELAKLGLNAD